MYEYSKESYQAYPEGSDAAPADESIRRDLCARPVPVLLGVCIVLLGCGVGSPSDGPRQVGATEQGGTPVDATEGSPPIRAEELDELTRAFADRYVGLLYSTCDALKKDNPDPVQRREAQALMVDCATNIYDIASNADAFTRMLDLVVVTTLVSQVWIDDDRVAEVFPGREELLIRALHHGRVEAWALAAQVLRPDQIDLLDYLLWDWRRHNPGMDRASFVRFSNFAIGRGKSANSEVLAAGGFFANVGQQGQAMDEARLLTERMFYMLKREPTLLRWQVDTIKEDLFIALDDRMKTADATVANVRAVISEANDLATTLGPTSQSINEMLKTADGLIARYDSMDSNLSRPFDIREYTEAIKELTLAAGKMNDMLKSSSELLGSSEWDRRIQQVSQSADERIKWRPSRANRWCTTPSAGSMWRSASCSYCSSSAWRRCSWSFGGSGSSRKTPVLRAERRSHDTAARDDGHGLRLCRHDRLFCTAIERTTQSEGSGCPEGRHFCPCLPGDDANSVAEVLPPYEPVVGLAGKIISIGDSTTTNLVARGAAEFRKMYPAVTLQVTASPISIGPAALLEGRADIVPMSRPLASEEVQAFVAKYGYPPTEIKVAADALAIYVEKGNPVPGLTLGQLDGIFSQTQRQGVRPIETWGQAGLTTEWADRRITLYGYGPEDGAHLIFQQTGAQWRRITAVSAGRGGRLVDRARRCRRSRSDRICQRILRV